MPACALETHPGLAPLYKYRNRNNKRHPRKSPCPDCPGFIYCQTLIYSIGWMLCEDPDVKQMRMWERRGVNIHAMVEWIRSEAPELWG